MTFRLSSDDLLYTVACMDSMDNQFLLRCQADQKLDIIVVCTFLRCRFIEYAQSLQNGLMVLFIDDDNQVLMKHPITLHRSG